MNARFGVAITAAAKHDAGTTRPHGARRNFGVAVPDLFTHGVHLGAIGMDMALAGAIDKVKAEVAAAAPHGAPSGMFSGALVPFNLETPPQAGGSR